MADASASFSSETGRIRSNVCDNTVKTLRILEVDRGVEQVTDIDIEHLVGMIKSSLMNQFALQVDGRAFWILEGDFETLATLMRVSGALSKIATLPMMGPK